MAAIKVTGPSFIGFGFASDKRSFPGDLFRRVDALEGCLIKRPTKGTAVAVDESIAFEVVRDEGDMSRPFADFASEEND